MEEYSNKGKLFLNRYYIHNLLGKGAFGEIYEGYDSINCIDVAIKTEKLNPKSNFSQLENEAKIYQEIQGGIGVPKFYRYESLENLNILIFEQLGSTLEELLSQCNHKFSLRASLAIADQLLSRIELLHSKNYIHRDIKPDNFLVGRGDSAATIYIIDLGLSKQFFVKNSHIPFKSNKKLTGTSRYASINTHLGYEQSRRDDLECMIYCILYFINGSLPWQGISVKNKEVKNKKIFELKSTMPVDVLFQNLPNELKTFYGYVRTLEFDEKPDYHYLKQLLYSVFMKNKYFENFKYDWEEDNKNTKYPQLFTNISKKVENLNLEMKNCQTLNGTTLHKALRPHKVKKQSEKNVQHSPENPKYHKTEDFNIDWEIPSENVKVKKVLLFDCLKNSLHYSKYRKYRINNLNVACNSEFNDHIAKFMASDKIDSGSAPFSPKNIKKGKL